MNTAELKIAFDNFEEATMVLKSIVHPIRLALIRQLIKHEQLSAKELQELIYLPQAIVSQHLSKLKHEGIVCEKNAEESKLHYLNKQIKNQIILSEIIN